MKVAAAAVALVLGVLFLLAFGLPLFNVITGVVTTAPVADPFVTGVATGLSGYVSGVVAVWFGVTPPGERGLAFDARLRRLSAGLDPTGRAREVLGWMYLVIYFGIFLVGFFVRLTSPTLTPDYVQNHLLVAFGLMIAIGTDFMSKKG